MDKSLTLELMQIASPCHVPWESMNGDEKVRFCAECKLNVYNVAGMSRQAAEQLINEREGRICLRLTKRADGTVLTQDCPVGLRAIRRRLARLISGTAALIAFLTFGAFFARGNSSANGACKGVGPLQRVVEWLDPLSPTTGGSVTSGAAQIRPPTVMPLATPPTSGSQVAPQEEPSQGD